MKNMKIREVGSPIFLDMFTLMGANPTQMSWADARPALSGGAVNGQENPLFLLTVFKIHTVRQKFVTTWSYVADPLIFVVNKKGVCFLGASQPGPCATRRHRRRLAGNRTGPQRPAANSRCA